MNTLTKTLSMSIMGLFFAGSLLASPLNDQTRQALIDALNDEYKAQAAYQKVIDQFGPVRPFTNIIKAEATHIRELLPLFEKYDVAVPDNNWYDSAPSFGALQEAFEASIQAEIDNAQMYAEFFEFVVEEDIRDVFARLRDASQDKHLPAFERAAGRAAGRTAQTPAGEVQRPGWGRSATDQPVSQDAPRPEFGKNQPNQPENQRGQRPGRGLNQAPQTPQGTSQTQPGTGTFGRGRR